MRTRIGLDIIRKKRFLQSVKRGKDAFLARMFTRQELRQNTHEQLASIFCLKEAVSKAMELPHDAWLTINTNRKANGKVAVSFTNDALAGSIASIDTSVSHEGEWIVAVAVVVYAKSR